MLRSIMGTVGDHVSILGMVGLPVMHHTTQENVFAWVDTHVEQLAEWLCGCVYTVLLHIICYRKAAVHFNLRIYDELIW